MTGMMEFLYFAEMLNLAILIRLCASHCHQKKLKLLVDFQIIRMDLDLDQKFTAVKAMLYTLAELMDLITWTTFGAQMITI